ncbi:DUF4158 domain-containing protein [Agrobacterium rhizogenes]|nr:DUF4158 domain-containing protein [Rhizobium rhizogenes]
MRDRRFSVCRPTMIIWSGTTRSPPSDLLEIQIRRRPPNQLGFAVQLCLMRYPGRTLAPGENLPPDTLGFTARQLDIGPNEFHVYARREPTRMAHVAFLLTYLRINGRGVHQAKGLHWLCPNLLQSNLVGKLPGT